MKRILAATCITLAGLGIGTAALGSHGAPAASAVRHQQFIDPPWVPRTFAPEISRDDPIHIAGAAPPVPLPLPTSSTTSSTVRPTTTTSTTVQPPPPSTTTTTAHTEAGSGYSTSCYPSVGMAPRNSTEACISKREHGGCYDASTNASHSGRWQMTESLFYSYGPPKPSNPNEAWREWRYASPSAQDAAFRGVVEHEGYGNWTPYDGC